MFREREKERERDFIKNDVTTGCDHGQQPVKQQIRSL